MLTVKMLRAMPPRTVFATGVVQEPRLHKDGPVRWVAIRGGVEDWAIYYHHATYPIELVAQEGDKCFTRSVIREFVPCNDAAYARYRF